MNFYPMMGVLAPGTRRHFWLGHRRPGGRVTSLNGMKVKGTTLNGSVAVLRCRVPCSAGSVLVYHLLPKEYLVDPPSSLPGLPANVSAEDFERLVPPPPLFRVGTTFWPGSKYHHAKHVDGLVTNLHPVRNRTHFPNDENGCSPPNQKAGNPLPQPTTFTPS